MKKTKSSLLIGGLVVVAIILGFTIVPSVVIGGSPLLLLFVLCPLMMVFMMGSMSKGEGMDHNNNNQQQQQTHRDHNPYGIMPAKTGLTPDERLAELKSQSTDLQTQQEALTHQINQMETAPVVREAEVVVRTADKHFKS